LLLWNLIDQPSIHGYLQCKSLKINRIPVIQGTNGFEVDSVTSHAIQIKHSNYEPVTLLSPYRIFKDVHNKSVCAHVFVIKNYTLKNIMIYYFIGNIIGCY